jgi:hypothetical protein
MNDYRKADDTITADIWKLEAIADMLSVMSNTQDMGLSEEIFTV